MDYKEFTKRIDWKVWEDKSLAVATHKGFLLMASKTYYKVFDAASMFEVDCSAPGTAELSVFQKEATRALFEILEKGLYQTQQTRQPRSPYERTRDAVYATGNKWQIEHFNATH